MLDTTAILAHYRKEAGWEKVQELFADPDSELLLCSVSLAEFARRLHSLGVPNEEILHAVREYSGLMTSVVAVDADIALKAFELSAAVTGRLPLADSLIAAAAVNAAAALVHRDAHFEGLGKLVECVLL